MAVTGGFGALGRVVVQRAWSRGWSVAALDRAEAIPPELAALPQDGVMTAPGMDLTNRESAESAVRAVVQRFGGLDALVNVAGGFRWTALEDSAPETWDLLFRLNVTTAANASRAALPALRRSSAGRIVNIGAAGAERAAAGMGPYAASKAGVHRLTESLAEELKDDGITVNAVLPSIIDTLQNRQEMPSADANAWVAPGQLAEVILFLASEEASAVTGALVRVTGRV